MQNEEQRQLAHEMAVDIMRTLCNRCKASGSWTPRECEKRGCITALENGCMKALKRVKHG